MPSDLLPAPARAESRVSHQEGGKRYGCLLADPPWPYEYWSSKGVQKAGEAHYGTQDLKWLKALPVQEIAAKDSTLLLWATVFAFPGCFEVVDAWGFTFK